MTHNKVCRNEIVFSKLFRLFLDRGLNERHAGQRFRPREIYETRSLDDVLQVNIDWIRNLLRVWPHENHFARMKHQRIAKDSVARQAQATFQNEHLDVLLGHVFHHDGSSGDGGGDRCCADFRAAQSLRDLEKH